MSDTINEPTTTPTAARSDAVAITSIDARRGLVGAGATIGAFIAGRALPWFVDRSFGDDDGIALSLGDLSKHLAFFGSDQAPSWFTTYVDGGWLLGVGALVWATLVAAGPAARTRVAAAITNAAAVAWSIAVAVFGLLPSDGEPSTVRLGTGAFVAIGCGVVGTVLSLRGAPHGEPRATGVDGAGRS